MHDDLPALDWKALMEVKSWQTAMTPAQLLSRISIDPNICFGKPCIRGHRIWVPLILDCLASGMSIAELLQEYSGLEEADIYACIAYGAGMRVNATLKFRFKWCVWD